VIPTASPGNYYDQLNGISGKGSNDQWAVGYELNKTGSTSLGNALAEHWNGVVWLDVSPPQSDFQLLSVKELTPSNVWAVGYSGQLGSEEVTIHWNGQSWNRVPNQSPNDYIFDGLTPRGSLSWVAGQNIVGSTVNPQMLKWNGYKSQWRPVATQIQGQGNGALVSVVSINSTSAWAVGNSNSPGDSLIEHWDGTAFTIDPSGTIAGGDLSSIISVGSRPKVVWAVGFNSTTAAPLIMTRCA
jgi:hypothetical protein